MKIFKEFTFYMIIIVFMIVCQISGILIAKGEEVFGIVIFLSEFLFLMILFTIAENSKKK